MKKTLCTLIILLTTVSIAKAAEPFRMQTGPQTQKQISQPAQSAQPTQKTSCNNYVLNWHPWKEIIHNQILALQASIPRRAAVSFPKKVEYIFDVDRSGNISNIKIKNLDTNGYISEYTEPGKSFYNIVRKLSHSPILRFLPDSNRSTMHVNVSSNLTTNSLYLYSGGAPDPSDTEIVYKCTYPNNSNVSAKNSGSLKNTKGLTEYEETIAWNQWHANLANEIHRLSNLRQEDFKVTIYKTKVYYSFDVDNNRNISNIIITVENLPSKNDTNKVITHFKTIINMMNNKPILKFVEGSQRTSVHVQDSIKWVNPGEEKTTNASKYSDYETVKKYK